MNRLIPFLMSLLFFSSYVGSVRGKEAVSLSETGSQSAQKANVRVTDEEQNLKRKATRRNPDGYKELSRYYIKEYRFSDAREALDNYKKYAKQPYCQAEEQVVETGLRLMMGIVDIVVIDSIVTDKSDFLQAYKLDADAGKLFRTTDFFAAEKEKKQANATQQNGQTNGEATDVPSVRPIIFQESSTVSIDSVKTDSLKEAYEGTLFLTGLGKNILYGDKGKIYSSTYRLNEWSKAQELSAEVNDSICNYPFLCADGQTLYFASTGHASLGGYDIFITRFNSETNNYLRPDNIGMPFNSPYNDYMMALDEITGLGWFASDRYQPEGKVCIYIFIPDANRKIIDIENTDKEILRQRAKLSSIKSTWINHEKEQQQGMAVLQEARNHHNANEAQQKQIDFYLVINDQLTYTSYLDFHSDLAAQKAEEWQSDCAKLEALKQSLAKSRDLYEAAPSTQQKKNSLNILDLEKQIRTLETTLSKTENEVRRLEIEALQ